MVGCDGLLWHQCIADYCLHADKELVAKVSQDAKERQLSTLKQGTEVPDGLHGAPREMETGKASEILAEIAGTGTCKYEALVEKISQAAKERKWSGKHTNLTSVPTEGIQEEPGEVSKKLAKIAGTNQYTKSLPAQKSESLNESKEQAKKIAEQMIP